MIYRNQYRLNGEKKNGKGVQELKAIIFYSNHFIFPVEYSTTYSH